MQLQLRRFEPKTQQTRAPAPDDAPRTACCLAAARPFLRGFLVLQNATRSLISASAWSISSDSAALCLSTADVSFCRPCLCHAATWASSASAAAILTLIL